MKILFYWKMLDLSFDEKIIIGTQRRRNRQQRINHAQNKNQSVCIVKPIKENSPKFFFKRSSKLAAETLSKEDKIRIYKLVQEQKEAKQKQFKKDFNWILDLFQK